jgi:hypothetical protein
MHKITDYTRECDSVGVDVALYQIIKSYEQHVEEPRNVVMPS